MDCRWFYRCQRSGTTGQYWYQFVGNESLLWTSMKYTMNEILVSSFIVALSTPPLPWQFFCIYFFLIQSCIFMEQNECWKCQNLIWRFNCKKSKNLVILLYWHFLQSMVSLISISYWLKCVQPLKTYFRVYFISMIGDIWKYRGYADLMLIIT